MQDILYAMPVKGSFNPQRGDDPHVENYCFESSHKLQVDISSTEISFKYLKREHLVHKFLQNLGKVEISPKCFILFQHTLRTKP